ncbi:FCD domain-containing protein [Micromonospora sp. DR5-3]|uniref:FCD domain-containing protein n=1 Tax=unclassified Micromonospora TaxID=2617518 RepID=UPI001651C075|nr:MULTISPECIES: FCD domain-containing protein [unclassified Micromonospora]MCW3817943.1 FCD domain-containing protein [Micromonospora sp. DR5-3]
MAQHDASDVMQVWRELSRRLRIAQESLDLTLRAAGAGSLADFEAIELLATSEGGALPQRQVQDALGLSQSGTSRLVTRLEKSGLLKRVTSAADARAANLEITPAGRAVVAQHRLDFEQRALAALQSLAESLATPGGFPTPALEPAAEPGGILQFGESLLSLGAQAVTVADAIHVRDALEPLVLIEAAQYRTDEDIADCERILAEMAARLSDAKRFYQADWSLHRRLAGLCRNTLLRTVYEGLLSTLESHVDDVVPTEGLRDYLRRRLVVHTEIIDAIASGRVDRVRAAANAHAITGLSAHVGVAS